MYRLVLEVLQIRITCLQITVILIVTYIFRMQTLRYFSEINTLVLDIYRNTT